MAHGGDIYKNKTELDFSVNVNPMVIPESVQQALLQATEKCSVYPDIRQKKLKNAISKMTGVCPEMIICGNGASELFIAAMHAVCPARVLIPQPSFSGYERAARAAGAEIIGYKLKEGNGFLPDRGILDALGRDIDMLVLANPNNPTGRLTDEGLLREIIESCSDNGIITILDESFIEFVEGYERISYFERAGQNECANECADDCKSELFDLIVIRSFTKYLGLPGVRLGYLTCGSVQLLEKIAMQLPEWNISVFAQEAGVAAAEETDYYRASSENIKTEREYLAKELMAMGIFVLPSDANFLLLYTEMPLYKRLLDMGILIRDCSDFDGLGDGYYRVAVKKREDNERLLDAVRAIINGR